MKHKSFIIIIFFFYLLQCPNLKYVIHKNKNSIFFFLLQGVQITPNSCDFDVAEQEKLLRNIFMHCAKMESDVWKHNS